LIVHGFCSTPDAARWLAWGKKKARHLLAQLRAGDAVTVGWTRRTFRDGSGMSVTIDLYPEQNMAIVRAEAGEMKPHGFLFRLREESVAPYGWKGSDDADGNVVLTPFVAPQQTALLRRIVRYHWDNVGDIAQYADQSDERQAVELDLALNEKITAGSARFPANQHAFIWSEDPSTGKWTPGATVWSWWHSSAGDAPLGVHDIGNTPEFSGVNDHLTMMLKSQFTAYWRESTSTWFSSGMSPESDYRVQTREYEHVVNPSISEYPFTIATDNGITNYLFIKAPLNAEIDRDGRRWWPSVLGTKPGHNGPYQLPFPYLAWAPECANIQNSYPIAVGPVSSKRALAVVCQTDSSAYPSRHKLVLYDLKFDPDLDVPSSHAKIAMLLDLPRNYRPPGASDDVKSVFPFFWPWRFNHSLTELSGLYVGATHEKPVSLATWTLRYDERTDAYTASKSADISYPARQVWTGSRVGNAASAITYTVELRVETPQSGIPYALDYGDDNRLKICWFKPRTEDRLNLVMHAESSGPVENHHASGTYQASGYFFAPGRGLRGHLEFPSGRVVPLTVDGTLSYPTESCNDSYEYHLTSPPDVVTGSRTENLTMHGKLTPLFVSAANEVALVAGRATSFSVTRTTPNTTVTSQDLPSGGKAWNDEGQTSRTDVGGTILRLYTPNGARTLIDSRQSVSTTQLTKRSFGASFREPNINTARGSLGCPSFWSELAVSQYYTTPDSYPTFPLYGLFPGSLPVGLLEETWPADEAGKEFYGLRSREAPSYGMAIDPRREEKPILLCVEFPKIEDKWVYHNYFAGQSGNGWVKHTVFDDNPSFAAERVVTELIVDPATTPEAENNLRAFLASLSPSPVSLYPISLY